MGVDGCGWPISANVSLMVRPSFSFTRSASNSDSAADDATHFNIVQRVKMAALGVIGSPSLGTEQRKNFPNARLLAFFADT